MSVPFVNELRAPDDVIRVGGTGGAVLQIRVQVAELWDALRVDAAASEPVASVKRAAISGFYNGGADPDDFVVKLHGFEVLHEDAPLSSVGVKDGSTLLLSRRRRRPVR